MEKSTIVAAITLWILSNVIFTAVFGILSRAHAYTIILSSLVSWLTSLLPAVSVGIIAGIIEARMVGLSWKDIKQEVKLLKEIYKYIGPEFVKSTKTFRVLYVAGMITLGSLVGSVTGILLTLNMLKVDIVAIKEKIIKMI